MYINLLLEELQFLIYAIKENNPGHSTAKKLIPIVEEEEEKRCRQSIRDLLIQRKRRKEWLEKLLKDGEENKDTYEKHYQHMRNPKRITELRKLLLERKRNKN